MASGLLPATIRPFQTRFRSGSGAERLNLATDSNSQAHSSIGTQSYLFLRKSTPTACMLRVSGSISLPYQGFFSPFPHGTLLYRSPALFSLGRWSSQIHTRLHESRVTQDTPRPLRFSITGLSPSTAGFPKTVPLTSRDPNRGPTTPADKSAGLGSSAFARRYSRNLF